MMVMTCLFLVLGCEWVGAVPPPLSACIVMLWDDVYLLLHILKNLQKSKVFYGTSMIMINSKLAVTFTEAFCMECACNLALNVVYRER
jgi:hypothetical protein